MYFPYSILTLLESDKSHIYLSSAKYSSLNSFNQRMNLFGFKQFRLKKRLSFTSFKKLLTGKYKKEKKFHPQHDK